MTTREELIAAGVIRPAAIQPVTEASTTTSPQTTLNRSNSIPEGSVADESRIETDWGETSRPSPHPSSTTLPPNGHFTNSLDFRDKLLKNGATEFISRYLFEPVPFAFHGNLDTWSKWKNQFAAAIEVDPREIVLAGSGALGFSLHPKKNLRAFTPKSDLDICVVNAHHFEAAWRCLRTLQRNLNDASDLQQKAIHSHRVGHLFDGTIATDKILAILPFGEKWQSALEALSKDGPTKDRALKLRIYRDFDSLRTYQMSGVRFWQAKLGSNIADETEIPEDKVREEQPNV